MAESPFDTTEETVEETKTPQRVEGPSQAKIVTTLKGGTGYDAPWIVIHADTPQEAIDLLNDKVMKELIEKTRVVADFFSQSEPAKKPAGKPAGASQPPEGSPACPPGWTYRTGVSKAGKPYQAYFPPKGSQESPIWL